MSTAATRSRTGRPRRRRRSATPRARAVPRLHATRDPATLPTWTRAQAINVRRHAAALGPFRREAFEAGASTVTEGHVQATNQLIERLRGQLMRVTDSMDRASRIAARDQQTESLQRMLVLKERAHDLVRATERVWDFYFELFTQRQSQFGPWLLACDRIALNCYQAYYTGIGVARTVPAPGPFSYMRTGFSPATFRRGIALSQIGRQPNPFPLVQLPYHRLVNPWTLGAVLHEVSHNLQNDLGLERAIPQRIGQRLREAGMPPIVAQTWTRWNRESFADLSGLLLGGPAIVASLMDVVGRAPSSVVAYSPRGPHPTPWLRTLLSCELLRRMSMEREAEGYERAWRRLYPDPTQGTIPRELLRTYRQAIRIVVDAVCREPYQTLGNRSLMRVIRFAPKDQALVEQAAERLAAGTDPGVVPPRYLIGAARVAFERRYARPGTITDRFYEELAGR